MAAVTMRSTIKLPTYVQTNKSRIYLYTGIGYIDRQNKTIIEKINKRWNKFRINVSPVRSKVGK